MIHKDKWSFTLNVSPKSNMRKHTTASINHALKPARIMLMDEYKNASALAFFRCECGFEWQSNVHNVLYLSKGCPSPVCPLPKIPLQLGRKTSGQNKKNRNFFAAANEVNRIDHITSFNLHQLVEDAHKQTDVDRKLILCIVVLTLRAVIVTREVYAQ